jgi:hypothetical protein
MQKLLSVIVAAAFAAVSFGAVAQTKDVTTKDANAAKTKGGQAVTTKDVKASPKYEPLKMPEQKAKKPTEPGTNVTTKSGGPVEGKDKKDVTTKGK